MIGARVCATWNEELNRAALRAVLRTVEEGTRGSSRDSVGSERRSPQLYAHWKKEPAALCLALCTVEEGIAALCTLCAWWRKEPAVFSLSSDLACLPSNLTLFAILRV